MTDTSRTHRCIDCPQKVEHTPLELCPACGRCPEHCQETQLCPKGATSTDRAVAIDIYWGSK